MQNNQLTEDLYYMTHGFNPLNLFEHKNILITGAAGFLGFNFSHFFLNLRKMGIPVKKLVLFDNFTFGRPAWIENIASDHTVIRPFDIAQDKLDLKIAHDINYVIHLASIASPTYYRRYPIPTMDANIWGLRNLLNFYKDKPIDGFLFFSSSEIYGDPPADKIPTPEDYRGNVASLGPRACYDESKRFGETLCYEFAKAYKMPISIVRPFNTYGPGMNIHDHRVPADFARAIIEGKNLEIFSDGSPTRTFCYVADALIGYLKALTYGKFDYFNIGMDRPEITITQLAEVYQKVGSNLLNYHENIIYKPPREKNYLTDNPSRRCPELSKAHQILDYNPTIDIDEGVERYLKFLIESGDGG